MRHKKIIVLLLASVLSLPMVSCTPKNKVPEFQAQYYPQCYDPIKKLCNDQDNTKEVKGAATGALLGALAGGLIGGLSKGNLQGALVGATAGAVAGGAIGFFSAKLSKIQDRKERLQAYQDVLGEQSKGWDLERASVEKAYTCYNEQINFLLKQARAKKISKAEFLSRMDEIRAGINHINEYWAKAQTKMDETLADGDKYLNDWAKEDEKLAAQKRQQAMQHHRMAVSTHASNKVKNTSRNAVTNQIKNKTEANVALADKFCKDMADFASLAHPKVA